MDIISSKKIKVILEDILIDKNIWLSDGKYRDINSSQLQGLIENIKTKENIYISNVYECEEFALSFVAEFRNSEAAKFISGDKDFSFNCPIGICSGVRFDGMKENHTKIIAICSDGIFLIEPQSNRINKFDKNKDEIFFVYM